MKFAYQARTQTGDVQTGIVEASNQEAAVEVLKSHGLFVTALEEFAPPIYAKKLKIFERVRRKDIVVFSRQLAIMFKSKVPLVESFQTIARQMKSAGFKEIILKISEAVEGGTSLSQALALYPKIFSPFYTSMVKSGEASGKLTDVFLYLADYLERDHAFRSKIKGAMIYPAFVLLVFGIVVTIIVTFVIPQLTEVLKESGQQLPLITRMVMAVAEFLRTKGWIVLLVLIVLATVITVFARSKKGKEFFERNLLKVPLLGLFLKKLYLSRIALNLSTLISGGLPIVQSLEITGEVVGNIVYKEIIIKTKEGVKRGETISSIIEKYPHLIFPLFYQMVVVGEKTGTLDTSLMNIVIFYERDVNDTLDGFLKLLEPLLIVFLGLIVGGLMGAVLIPLYTMGLGE